MGSASTAIESVAVVGAGFMGTGIAETVAVAGLPVIVTDLGEVGLGRARSRLYTSPEGAGTGGKLDAAHADVARRRIELTTELDAIAGAALVVEAVPEELQLKLGVMRPIDSVAGPETIVASNTSSIPIAELAQVLVAPDRMLGLHFFSPVPVMTLVEVVVALDTSDDTLAAAKAFVERIGKRPIETKDRAGARA